MKIHYFITTLEGLDNFFLFVELLFLLFLIAVCTCSVVMFICVGCSLCTFLVIFLFVVLVL